MKQITISLRDDELEVIEKLEKSLGLVRHQVVKLAIRRFLFPKSVEKIPLDGAYASVVGTFHMGDPETVAILKKHYDETPGVRDAVEVLPKCEVCENLEPHPEERYLVACSDAELKKQGLKKYTCSRCGRRHVTPIDNIVIQESPMEKEKRLKLEKARAEAEKFIKSATDPIDKFLKEGLASHRLRKVQREVDE